MRRVLSLFLSVALFLALFIAAPQETQAADTYSVSGSNILKNGTAARFVGTNAMTQYGLPQTDISSWDLNIAREMITVNATPISGGTVQVGGSYYRSMQTIVDHNRAQGIITILAPHGYWNGSESVSFVGLTPSSQSWYEDFLSDYRDIANHFKNQPDVWFDVWNEPFWYDNSNGYSHNLWLSEMSALVDNIRSTGATNIISVPGNESGQSEDAILAKGADLLNGRSNIIFDQHAYENWLLDSKANIKSRIAAVRNAGFALIFGEVAPRNSQMMDPTTFLSAVKEEGNTVLAWFWKHNGSDANALLDANGNPNDNNNYNWGTTFKNFAADFYNGYTPPSSGSNLVSNPGFESGTSGWGGWGAYSAVQSNARSGSYAGKIGTNTGSLEQTISGLQPNTTYTLKAWMKVDTSGNEIRLGVKNYGGTEQQQTVTSTGYTQKSITFTTGTSNTSAFIYCYKPTSGYNAYCDDFELVAGSGTAANLMTNSGFESGSTGWSGWGAKSVVSSNARSGSNAGQIGTSSGAHEQTITGLQPNTSYTLKGWAKVVASGTSVSIGVKNYGGTEMSQSVTTTGYTQVSITFTTGSNNTSALVYAYKPGTSNYAYCDDFELVKN